MLKLSIIAIAIALTGCASTDYTRYTTAQQAMAASKAQADTARYNALADIAKNGSDTARVAAVMALAMGGQAPQQSQALAAPQRSDALMWASVLVPAVTQAYSIAKSADVAINASNNAYLTSASTTAGFVGIASQIQAPVVAAPVLPQADVSTVTTTTTTSSADQILSGTGVLGSGSYSTQANPTTTTSTPVFAPVIVPDTVINQPVVVPDVIQITPVIQ